MKKPTRGDYVWLTVVLVILSFIVANIPDETKKTAAKLESIDAARSANSAANDKELYLDYYARLIVKTEEADQLFQPFALALKNGDVLSATQIALKIKQPLSFAWGEISAMKPPKLHNETARDRLNQAHEAIGGAYLYKSKMIKDFIEFAESQNIKKMAELKNRAEDIQTLIVGGTMNLMASGESLGIQASELKKKQDPKIR